MSDPGHWEIPGVEKDMILGPLFVSHCINWCLYGILILQVYLFYSSFPRDALRFKILTYTIFILDTASIAIATYSGYWVFVTHWGNVKVFTGLGWSWASVPASSGLLAFIVQAFFAYRIWKVSNQLYMPIFIIILSGIACGFSFASAVEVSRLQTFKYIRNRTPSIWLSFGIAADFFVCASLVYYLLRSPTRFHLTTRLVIRLVRLSIETSLVTIIAAAVKLYLIFSRHDNMHLLICLLLPRLYSNAFLGTLNSRNPIFGGNHTLHSRREGRTISTSGGSTSFNSIAKPSLPLYSPPPLSTIDERERAPFMENHSPMQTNTPSLGHSHNQSHSPTITSTGSPNVVVTASYSDRGGGERDRDFDPEAQYVEYIRDPNTGLPTSASYMLSPLSPNNGFANINPISPLTPPPSARAPLS